MIASIIMTCDYILGNVLRENLTCFDGTDSLVCGIVEYPDDGQNGSEVASKYAT